ncbi:MAG: PIN domain-containing protein [Defluviitaleaceae bacterium]|nr:PIN domain-containing protein [Defluviitaleaceae bacterium]
MKVLVDTNVILDFLLSREPNATDAEKIFAMISKEEISAFTTASSITDIYYVTAKRLGDNAARQAIRQLLKMFGVIAVDGNDCANALNLPMVDFEDALVVTCAEKEDVEYIVTNDKEFSQVDLKFAKIISAQNFITIYSQRRQ